MADQEHLDFLVYCIKENDFRSWNKLRDKNKHLQIDLTDSKLKNVYLRWFNLSNTNLSNADLSGATLLQTNLAYARLCEVNFSNADLSQTNLHGANLCRSYFFQANLSRANLCDTNLFQANLSEASLREVNLSQANLRETNLAKANLVKANLVKANLRVVLLNGVNLSKANLSGAYLCFSHLSEANLSDANLSEANLYGSTFKHVNFYRSNLKNSILTGSKLYNIASEEWNINGVKCDYIFIDKEGKQRFPVDRDFEPEEFEERFKSLPSFEIPCRNPSEILFATQISDYYNHEVNTTTGVALKSIDIPTEAAVFTLMKKEDKEKVEKDFLELQQNYLRLEGALSLSRLDFKDTLNALKESNMTTNNNFNGTVWGVQNGDNCTQNNTQTFNNTYNEAAQKMKEEIEKSESLSDDIKNILLEKLKSYAIDKGKSLLDYAFNNLTPAIIASIPTLQQILN